MASAKPGIWVMVSGVFLTVTGGAAYAACAPENSVSTAPTGCVDLAGVLVVGIFLAILGTIVAIIGHAMRTQEPTGPPAPVPEGGLGRPVAPPPARPAVYRSTAVHRQVSPQAVEIRCPYCDHLRDLTYGGCPVCGAWTSSLGRPSSGMGRPGP